MRYENLQYYDDKFFKCLTGVNKDLFAQMINVLKHSESLNKETSRPIMHKPNRHHQTMASLM